MKITVLCENVSHAPEIEAEHGLSLFVESEGRRILFDMGQTELFARNANILGVKLSQIDLAVLSHGHYDHGGGLESFLRENLTAPVYVHPKAFEAHFHGAEKYIGLASSLKENERFVATDNVTELSEGITLHPASCVPRNNPSLPHGLTVEVNGQLVPDSFEHEQYMLIEEKGKRVLFSGCSHIGILNVAEHFRPQVLIGGFHTSKAEEAKLDEIAERLGKLQTVFYTCHCTGEKQFDYLSCRMHNIRYLSCGQVLTI